LVAKIPADAKLIPGHGPVSTLEDLKAYHAMLVETTGLVRERIAAGKTLDQAKAEGLPEKWKDWGSGFISTDRWIEIVHRSLSKSSPTGR
ncbi:MAG TPA: MBL fold metallo-hydrolase, partial [Planctomycetota bacterium]|nr:MBL fold metallo-hydrolase [Planctomycetota bacterium]